MTVLLGLSTYRQTDSNPRSRFTYSPFRTPSFRLRDGPVRQNGNHPFATGFLVAALTRGHPTAVSLGVIIGGVIIMSGIALVCLPNYPIKVVLFRQQTMSGESGTNSVIGSTQGPVTSSNPIWQRAADWSAKAQSLARVMKIRLLVFLQHG